jgi:DNA-binding YbaB/EbfC family protein
MKNSLGDIMKQAQAMQEQLQKVQSEISALEVTGEAGAGLVRVTMNGNHELKRVAIDQSLYKEDKSMLEDLIAAAVNDACRRLGKVSQDKMSGLTAGLNLPAGMKLPF